MRVVKNIAFFLTAVVIAKPLGFLLTFILAKSLGPVNFGVWVTLMLLVSYSPIVSLGTVETLLKQVPYFLGRNCPIGVKEVENAVMGSITLTAFAFVGLAFASPFVLGVASIGIDPFLIIVVLLTIAVTSFSAFFYHRFAAYENFKIAGTMDFLRAVLAVVCIGGMAWLWRLRGAALGYFLHEVVMCATLVVTNVRSHGPVGISFRRELLVNAVRIGLPITLLWWCLTLTGSVDRLVLGGMLGAESVGYFGLGISVAGLLALVPMVVGRVLYPKVNRQFGSNPDSDSMRQVVIAPTLALSTLLVNLQAILLVLMPFLYTWVLPKYLPGLMAGQILMLGSFFSCLLRNGANYLIAGNQQRRFLLYIVATLVSAALFDVGLVKTGFGIEGVALGTSLAGLLLTTLVWRRVLKSLGFATRRAWAILFGLYLPHIVLVVAVAFLHLFHPSTLRTPNLSSIITGGALLLLGVNGTLFCLPWHRREMLGWVTATVNVMRPILAFAGIRLGAKPETRPIV
jgi:O-antigen/teichoic acid export membrane protein